jgi:molybdopterin converting factor subunit 1
MTVSVRLFASCAEAFGASHIAVAVDDPATVRALREALSHALQATAGPIVARSLIAVNAEYAEDNQVIGDADEVALIPPVSGG